MACLGKALPDELIRTRPVISLGYGWALLDVGEIEASEARLRDAERWLEPADQQVENSSPRMVVVDEAEFRVTARLDCCRPRLSRPGFGRYPWHEKVRAVKRWHLSPTMITIHRTQATALLGMAEYAEGNLPAAEQEFLQFQAMMWQANDIANAISITYILANIMLVQGSLAGSRQRLPAVLKLAAKQGASSFLGASDLYRGMSEVLCEQGDLEGAAQQLQTAQTVGRKA